jgi:hypothetical protein
LLAVVVGKHRAGRDVAPGNGDVVRLDAGELHVDALRGRR